ncbi:hypothetical protein Tco_0521919, partial [Tanacetum coccineum]
MAALEFCKKHNMVAYLIKTEGSEDFHEIINFLSGSHISYALTESPILYRSIIDQFWRTAVLSTTEEGDQAITATVDDKVIIISEASLRRHLKVKDSEGVPSLPNEEIFEPLTNMGTYPTPTLTNKLFNNMRRPTKGYYGVIIPLFANMLVQPQAEASSSSPLRITSSPSQSSEPSPEHTTTAAPSTYELQHSEPSPDAEGHVPTPHDSPLHSVHSHGSDEIKTGKAKRRAKLVLSDDKDIVDDSSKQGRKISNIDEDPNTFLAQDEGVTWFQDDTDIQEVHQKQSHDTEVVIERGEPIEIVEDQGSGEKEVSTVDIPISTAGVTTHTATETPIVSTAGVNISTTSTIRNTFRSITGRVVYSRRSVDKAKDKGKAIMTEPKPQKRSKKLLEQERLGFETAIRLQEQADEEEKAQIARDEEIARQLEEQERQRVVTKAKSTKDIDWNDPSIQIYYALKNKPKTEAQARKNMITYLKNQGNYKIKVQKEYVETEQVEKDSSKKSGGKRKKSLARKRTRETLSEEVAKKQKVEEDAEKEELKVYLDIIPGDDVAIDVDSLSTKYPIVDWKSYIVSETFMYYQIFRADGSSKNYKILSEMLEYFDRQDVEDLYRLVKERYKTSRPE